MAYVRANLFYEREQWKGPLLLSVGFHGLLVLAILGASYVMQPHANANWGTNQGDAVEAQLVSAAIPIPHPAEPTENIVANESKGVTQTQPQPKPVETEDGVSIPGKVTPRARGGSPRQKKLTDLCRRHREFHALCPRRWRRPCLTAKAGR